MTDLIPVDPEALGDAAREFATASKAPSTLRNYRLGLAEFASWCRANGRESLPASPAAVADYLSALAESGAKASTIALRRSAIGFAHRAKNLPDPTAAEVVRTVLGGIVRKIGTRHDQKAPLTTDELRQVLAELPDTLTGARDRCLLLVGFACALRRSEVVALDAADLQLTATELRVTIRKSKTDQEAAGAEIVVPAIPGELDPLDATRAWLDQSGITRGPLFRKIDRWGRVCQARLTAQSVALIVKAAARAAGLDWRRFSGHSLRSGFATSAILANATPADAMTVTRHRSEDVFRGYIRRAGVQQRRAIAAAFGNREDQT